MKKKVKKKTYLDKDLWIVRNRGKKHIIESLTCKVKIKNDAFCRNQTFLHVSRINSFNILANHFKESRWKNIPQYIKFFQAWICNYLKQSDGSVENKVFQWLAIQPRIYFYLFEIFILLMKKCFCWLSRKLEKV